jgi:hypothetical protein
MSSSRTVLAADVARAEGPAAAPTDPFQRMPAELILSVLIHIDEADGLEAIIAASRAVARIFATNRRHVLLNILSKVIYPHAVGDAIAAVMCPPWYSQSTERWAPLFLVRAERAQLRIRSHLPCWFKLVQHNST